MSDELLTQLGLEEAEESLNLPEISDLDLAKIYAGSMGECPDAQEDEITWLPSLTPKQLNVFFDDTMFLMVEGSRFSGKGWCVSYAAVKHAYDYSNALVLVVAKSKRQALAGGIMSKMAGEILPDFQRHVEGFEWRGPRMTAEKDIILEVKNRYGTWSVIQLVSIQHDQEVARKTKGIEVSLVVIDEAQLWQDPEIFEQLSNTLGRRNHVPPEAQRLIVTCNPDGPSHWLYKTWYGVGRVDKEDRDPSFRSIRIMKDDNPDSKVQLYYQRLERTLANRPTQKARDVDGLWVDLPSGDAIFGQTFIPDLHVKGNLLEGTGLRPKQGLPIIIGYDLGDANHGVVFLQERFTKDRSVWVVFDEIVHVGKRISTEHITSQVMSKMQMWCEAEDFDFTFLHWSDNSAFNRFRASSGSYDYLVVERHSRKVLTNYPRLRVPIRLQEAPKPKGSVSARGRLMEDLLTSESIYFSVTCKQVIESISKISGSKDDPYSPDTHSPYKHAYDALTYPLFALNVSTGSVNEEELKPQVTTARGTN